MGKMERIAQIAKDPRWWSFYLQRRVSNPTRRAALARRLSSFKPSYTPVDQTRAKAGERDLNSSGLHELGQLLSTKQAGELVTYFEQKQVRDPYRSTVPHFLPLSNARPTEAHIAHHEARDILNAPYLLEIANDPRILDVVGEFLGCKPTIGYMATWWSYATEVGPQQAENFHRDVDDWRFVKLFVYLTQVDMENGPHKYVLHSSAQPKLTQVRRFNDDEVAAAFGKENIRTMTSKAGEGFLENTYGIHKGQPVQLGHRLLFQVVYTMTPLPYAPKVPVMDMPARASYDPWINRLYLK
ncbi:hypothetical protein ACGYLX_18110 [Sulfitobacter sp. 1A13496]|uniref:hypothetical protein n=1 Tax=Sulfitobacter sp. 1A13496 TaxID=3368596 RepID=UPI0037477ED3